MCVEQICYQDSEKMSELQFQKQETEVKQEREVGRMFTSVSYPQSGTILPLIPWITTTLITYSVNSAFCEYSTDVSSSGKTFLSFKDRIDDLTVFLLFLSPPPAQILLSLRDYMSVNVTMLRAKELCTFSKSYYLFINNLRVND